MSSQSDCFQHSAKVKEPAGRVQCIYYINQEMLELKRERAQKDNTELEDVDLTK